MAGQLTSGAIVKMGEQGDPVGKPVTIVSAGGTITYTLARGVRAEDRQRDRQVTEPS